MVPEQTLDGGIRGLSIEPGGIVVESNPLTHLLRLVGIRFILEFVEKLLETANAADVLRRTGVFTFYDPGITLSKRLTVVVVDPLD